MVKSFFVAMIIWSMAKKQVNPIADRFMYIKLTRVGPEGMKNEEVVNNVTY